MNVKHDRVFSIAGIRDMYSHCKSRTRVLNPVKINHTKYEKGCGKVFHFKTSRKYGSIPMKKSIMLMREKKSSLVISYFLKNHSLGMSHAGNIGKYFSRSDASRKDLPSSMTSRRRRSSSAVKTISEFPEAVPMLVSISRHLRVNPS